MNKSIYDKAINECVEGKSPIFYVDIEFILTTGKKKSRHVSKKIVVKGTYSEILKSKKSKISVLIVYLRDKKKAYSFDLLKIELVSIYFVKFMSYGVKE